MSDKCQPNKQAVPFYSPTFAPKLKLVRKETLDHSSISVVCMFRQRSRNKQIRHAQRSYCQGRPCGQKGRRHDHLSDDGSERGIKQWLWHSPETLFAPHTH